ncbi:MULTISPECIES: hypothetical protein [unclassified Streptomyces]|uniref:phosphatase domain-containing protein n=1 Tax=unclassified Streptomyces TaxID=2593676 RepID=UPI00381D51FE
MTETRRPWAVFDIDGVVADVAHRVVHLTASPPDWEAFFSLAGSDAPLRAGVALASELMATHEVAWITGRPERIRSMTTEWLRAQNLPVVHLSMRPDGDDRPASVLKTAWLAELARIRRIDLVVEDDDAVVASVRAAGWPVRQVSWATQAPHLHLAQEQWGRT